MNLIIDQQAEDLRIFVLKLCFVILILFTMVGPTLYMMNFMFR